MSTDEEFQKLKEQVERLEEKLNKILQEPKIITQIQSTQPTKELSLREFLLEKNPGSANDKTLTIGYFFEKFRNYDSFTKKDIEEGYREVKETLPKNVSDTIAQNVAKGTMMHAKSKKDGKDAWVVTARGEKFVENRFKDVK